MSQTSTIIELKDVCKSFDDTVAVENFNLSIQKGEFVTFLGPSGCGNTAERRGHKQTAAQQAPGKYRVPALRPIPSSECI